MQICDLGLCPVTLGLDHYLHPKDPLGSLCVQMWPFSDRFFLFFFASRRKGEGGRGVSRLGFAAQNKTAQNKTEQGKAKGGGGGGVRSWGNAAQNKCRAV